MFESCDKKWLGVRRVVQSGRVRRVMSEWVTVRGRGRYQSECAGGKHGWVGAQRWWVQILEKLGRAREWMKVVERKWPGKIWADGGWATARMGRMAEW